MATMDMLRASTIVVDNARSPAASETKSSEMYQLPPLRSLARPSGPTWRALARSTSHRRRKPENGYRQQQHHQNFVLRHHSHDTLYNKSILACTDDMFSRWGNSIPAKATLRRMQSAPPMQARSYSIMPNKLEKQNTDFPTLSTFYSRSADRTPLAPVRWRRMEDDDEEHEQEPQPHDDPAVVDASPVDVTPKVPTRRNSSNRLYELLSAATLATSTPDGRCSITSDSGCLLASNASILGATSTTATQTKDHALHWQSVARVWNSTGGPPTTTSTATTTPRTAISGTASTSSTASSSSPATTDIRHQRRYHRSLTNV